MSKNPNYSSETERTSGKNSQKNCGKNSYESSGKNSSSGRNKGTGSSYRQENKNTEDSYDSEE